MIISRLGKYIENTKEIRALSSPSLDTIDSPGAYESVLQSNFRKIGELAAENKETLGDLFSNAIKTDYELSQEEIREIIDIFFDMVNDNEIENLDLPLSNIISTHIWENERKNIDTELSVLVAEMHAVSCNLMMQCTYRTYPFAKDCKTYSEKGREACDYLLSLLEPEKWKEITDLKTRQTILKRVAFKHSFYFVGEERFKNNEKILDILRRAKSVEDDELYADTFTPEEWISYKIHLREDIGALLVSGNVLNFTYIQCCEIKEYMEELMTLWKQYPEICMETTSYSLTLLYYYRACYFTGDIQGTVYKAKLLEIYKSRSTRQFKKTDVILNLLIPVEYVSHMKKRKTVEGELATLEQFYRNAINYVFQCPNSGTIMFVLDYLLQLLFHFQEIPGGTTFEDVGLECLAALHPPTYVHSKMVANITRCLCKHAMRLKPELFSKMVGCSDKDKINSYRGEILDFAYHSALCHDFGKIAIMDTVFTYGRNIFDSEFEQIKAHPSIGKLLMSGNNSTAKYVNIALGHHRWFNNEGGYPSDQEITYKEKIIIDIVTCADCMDAATDTAGRSYSKGISLDQFVSEIKEQLGTRYADFLPELLENEEVRKDLEFLLTEVRQILYRDTFVMLRRLQRLGTGYIELFGSLGE